MTVHLVLASASPARRTLLRRAGIEPSIHVSDVDEAAVVEAARAAYGPLDPGDTALLLARAKAEAVCRSLASPEATHLVLGCDSILEIDGVAHGKPGTAEVATERWRMMRDRTGVLHTGHWLVDERAAGSLGVVGATASTTVRFADVTDEEITGYVATGEPLGVAGGFTLEGLGAPFIEGIDGDPSNVMGLSLPLLRALLAEVGVAWFDLAIGSGRP
ncbi:MAG: Maf family protein [Nostocoides sp.]